MKTDEIATITFEKIYDKHRWLIVCGNMQILGYCNSFSDAEKKAHEAVKTIPNHKMIHSIFKDGKSVVPVGG